MDEFRIWIAYRKLNGPMNDARRYDRPAALISAILSRANGGKGKIADYMPFSRKIDTDREPTLEEIMAAFQGK